MQDRGLKQSLYAVLKGTNLYAHTRSYWPCASKHITHLKLGFCNAETPSFAVNGTEPGSCGAGPEEAADPPLGTAPVEQRVPPQLCATRPVGSGGPGRESISRPRMQKPLSAFAFTPVAGPEVAVRALLHLNCPDHFHLEPPPTPSVLGLH